jgi:hypothetical protein
MSCGCQKRVATNGVSTCSSCLAKYEAKLKTLRTANPQNINITSVTYNSAKK